MDWVAYWWGRYGCSSHSTKGFQGAVLLYIWSPVSQIWTQLLHYKLVTRYFISWSNPILINWRPAVHWDFPYRECYLSQLWCFFIGGSAYKCFEMTFYRFEKQIMLALNHSKVHKITLCLKMKQNNLSFQSISFQTQLSWSNLMPSWLEKEFCNQK